MKIPFHYSMIKEDYGIFSLINAIQFLFEKEEIKENWIEEIFYYYQNKKQKKERKNIENWFFDKKIDDLISCEYILGENVNLKNIRKCFIEKGCMITKVYQNKNYVLITDIDEKFVYLFDPFLPLKEDQEYNQKVPISTFIHGIERTYSLGPIRNRSCLFLYRSIKIFDYEKNG